MSFYDSVAVFDLDGTLWKENSHLFVLNKFYNTSFYNSFCFKILYKILPSLMQKYIDHKIECVPNEFVYGLHYTYNNDILNLLHKKKQAYEVLIISNAPQCIVNYASHTFGIVALNAPIGKKLQILKSYCSFNHLFVCTDNRADYDLLSVADNFYFIKKRNRVI
jgi:phosphoserine phosphatase